MLKVGLILAYPLQEQINVGHIDNLKDMYNNLLKMFDEVHVFSPRDTKKYNLGKDIFVHSLNNGGSRPWSLFLDGLQIRKMLKKLNIDVIRALDTVSGFSGYIATVGTNVPHIISIHRDRKLVYQQQKRNYSKIYLGTMDYIENLVLKNAALIPVISEHIKQVAVRQGAAEEKIFLHNNFVDPEIFKPIDVEKKNQILYVGRFDGAKKVDLAIKVFTEVLKKHPDYELIIAGTGPDEKQLKNLAKECAIQDSVKFLGAVPHNNLPKLYSESKLFISPALSGYTLIESLFCGLPIVAVDLEWTKEIVKSGFNGIVTKQNEKALANSVIKVLNNYSFYEKNALASKEDLDKFTKKNWLKRELQMYKKVLKQK